MNAYTLTVVRVDTRQPIPRLSVTRPRMEPGFVSERVPLSGVVASLLLRPGRMLNVTPKSAGPKTLNLFCAPLPNGGLSYVGLMSETSASYAASTIPRHGKISECDLIFQTTSFQTQRTTDLEFKFSVRRDACLKSNIVPTARRKASVGVHPTGVLFAMEG